MKFSFRQIVASAGGGVLAAVIASFFGVKGTIVGVGIGSAAATFGTAFVAQSLDRGQKAVKQVVVRVPDTSTLLRRLGGTGTSGVASTESGASDESSLTEDTSNAALTGDEASFPTEAVTAPETEPATEVVAPVEDDPATEVLSPPPPIDPATEVVTSVAELAPVRPRRLRWPVIAGTAAIVFILSLMFVTTVELIAGRPLANLFGGNAKDGSTTVGHFISPPVTTTTTPTPTTSTTTSTSSTTSTTTSSTTTTSLPGSTTSSTDDGTGTSTTTTAGASSTTSTTTPG